MNLTSKRSQVGNENYYPKKTTPKESQKKTLLYSSNQNC
jgi:hypothetical protein